MKYDEIKNINYVATVVQIAALEDLEGLDNLKSFRAFGMQTLVSKDLPLGTIGVLFSTEVQLSEAFARENNLHRHTFDWERATLDLWDTRASRRSVIQIDPTTLGASVSLAPTDDTENNTRSTPTPSGLGPGRRPIPNGQSNGKTGTENNAPGTSGNAASGKLPSNGTDGGTPNASTPSPSTESRPNGTLPDTLNFEDAVNYVRSGGKFLSWITTTIPGLSGASSAGAATLLSAGLEILSQACDGLSLTSNEKDQFFRKFSINNDPTITTGYLEDNRRVKAIRLRGHRSDSLFMPLTAFAYLGVKPEDFTVGDVFDSINGQEVCRKYVIREPKENRGPQARVRKVDVKNFPVHVDTENYWRNLEKIPQDREVVITQKLHGTSARYGRVLVERDLKWYEKIARKVGIKVQTHEYRFVAGSRMVVKSIDGDAESAGKQHYY